MYQTQRNVIIHEKYDRAGHVTGNREQHKAINWDDVPDPTKRNQHDKYDRAGHVTGNREQHKAVNWDDVPDPTKRNQHEKYDRAGHVTGNREQYVSINWDDVPDPTKRNQHEKYDRAGHVTGNKEQYLAIDWDDVPDPTKREMHPGGRAGGAYDDRQGYRAINWDDVPDPTKREMHPGGRTAGAGGAYSYDKRQGSRHQYMVMRMDGAKEALEEGRAPTAVGQNKEWTIDYTAFRHRCPVETTWRPGPNSDIMYVSDRYNSVNTNIPVGKFYVNNRILAYTEENLRGNPLVSNLIHRSI